MSTRSQPASTAHSAAGPDPEVEDRVDDTVAALTDDELAELAMAADPDAPLDPDAVPLRLGDPGAALLPEWYMPGTLRADAFGRTRRGRAFVVGGIVAALLLVNGLGLCVTYGFPEIAW